MKHVFFIVGPTASGKSEIGADVARHLDVAEIVSADAFQIYRGLDLLTAKPDRATLAKAPHHLLSAISIHEEMSAAKFRRMALRAIDEIQSRGRRPLVVGGSGLYIKALTHGLSFAPAPNRELRAELNELSLDQLRARLVDLDPARADKSDMKNRRRLVRAIEICLLTGCPDSTQPRRWGAAAGDALCGEMPRLKKAATASPGVFLFRDRAELYARINRRVEAMFENGVIDEVRAAGAMSLTAVKMIGLCEIREFLEGKMSLQQCVAQIQRATRRYAKRQLTWFRRQTKFKPLNLSLLTHKEAVEWISQLVKSLGVAQRDD